MLFNKTKRCLLILIIPFVFYGCSTTSPMKVALTELGTSSRSEYGVYGVRYMRSINITGLAPEETVGTISMDPDKWSLIEQLRRLNLNPKDLPDTLTPRLNFGPSLVYERTFCDQNIPATESNCPTIEDLVNIRNTIGLQAALIGKLANAKIELKVLELSKTAINNKPEEAVKVLDALKIKYQSTSSLKDANATNYQAKIEEAVVFLESEIAAIQVELEQNKKSTDKPGIIITNWKFESDLSAEGGLPGLNGSISKSKDSSGYAILGNPVVLTLHIGNDLHHWDTPTAVGDTDYEKIFKEERLYLTFYQVRAQQVVYTESLESIIAAQFDLKVKELADTLKPILSPADILELNKLELEIAAKFAQYNLSSNQGILDASAGNLKIRTYDNTFCADLKNTLGKNQCIENAHLKSVPIINSRVNLKKFLDKFKSFSKEAI